MTSLFSPLPLLLLAATAAAQCPDLSFNAYTVGSIDGQFGWTARDAFTTSTTIGNWDQGIVLDGTTKVFRMSNARTSGTYSSQVFSPVTPQVAGETGSALWNDRGTNGSAPTPRQFGAYAATNKFWSQVSFRSATGAAQPGLQVTLSPGAKQDAVRMGYLQIADNGSTGIDLKVYDLLANGTFPAAPTTIASGLSYTATHELTITIDFVDGVTTVGPDVYANDVLKVYLNGTLIHTGSTWETYYYFNEPVGPGLPRKQAVNAMLFRVAGTAAAGTLGNGFYFSEFRAANVAPNGAPEAANDSYTMDEDTVLTVAAPGVIGNDTDCESDPLTASLVSGPTNGALTLHPDGSFTYTPNANYFGADSFTYKVNDGTQDSGTATVDITISDMPEPIAVTMTGLGQPIDMPPTINTARAGRAIPIKFRLTGPTGAGLQVPGLTVVVSSFVTTVGSGSEDAIETYVGSSGLQYLGDGYYQFNWATPSTYANQNRTMRVTCTADGYVINNAVPMEALFKFRK